jgi:hypothetical protein
MINQAIEAELVEDSGHEMGCWEYWVERLIESAPELALEGSHAEIHPVTQMTLMDMFYAETTRETWKISRCECDVPSTLDRIYQES